SSRHFVGGSQDEGVRPRRVIADQAKDAVVHPRISTEFRQVAAYQCEIVLVIELADTANALERALIAELAAQRVGRIGRIGYDAAAADDFYSARDEAGLRVVGVNLEELAH